MNKIVLFAALGDNFFVTRCKIKCPVNKYCAYDRADEFPGVENVFLKKLHKLYENVYMSEAVRVDMGLNRGNCVYVSLSHKGILAISARSPFSRLQITNIHTMNQYMMRMEDDTLVGFYDDCALIMTHFRRLRRTTMEKMNAIKNKRAFEVAGGEFSYCSTDVTLLNEVRRVIYRTTAGDVFEYDVDAKRERIVTQVNPLYSFASMTGIDLGVRGIFRSVGHGHKVYTLNYDYSSSLLIDDNPQYFVNIAIPSSSDNHDLSKLLTIYSHGVSYRGSIKEEKWRGPVTYIPYQPMVRVFRDVFLIFNSRKMRWVLTRIINV